MPYCFCYFWPMPCSLGFWKTHTWVDPNTSLSLWCNSTCNNMFWISNQMLNWTNKIRIQSGTAHNKLMKAPLKWLHHHWRESYSPSHRAWCAPSKTTLLWGRLKYEISFFESTQFVHRWRNICSWLPCGACAPSGQWHAAGEPWNVEFNIVKSIFNNRGWSGVGNLIVIDKILHKWIMILCFLMGNLTLTTDVSNLSHLDLRMLINVVRASM